MNILQICKMGLKVLVVMGATGVAQSASASITPCDSRLCGGDAFAWASTIHGSDRQHVATPGGNASASAGYAHPDARATVNVSANARSKTLKAYASSGNWNAHLNGASAHGAASIIDVIQVDKDAAFEFNPAKAHGEFDFAGYSPASIGGNFAVYFGFSITDMSTGSELELGRWAQYGLGLPEDFDDPVDLSTTTLRAGKDYLIRMSVQIICDVQNKTGHTESGDGWATAICDFGNTFRWGGVSSITDANGNPIDVTLTSGAGIDWLTASADDAPVPEPAALGLLGLGVLGLAAGRRRKAA